MGIWCQNDVVLTSMRRDDVASTSRRRHFVTKYPLGSFICIKALASAISAVVAFPPHLQSLPASDICIASAIFKALVPHPQYLICIRHFASSAPLTVNGNSLLFVGLLFSSCNNILSFWFRTVLEVAATNRYIYRDID